MERRRSQLFDMDSTIGLILLIGVLLSMILIAVGCVWRWMNTGQLQLEYQLPATNLFQFWLEDAHQAMNGAWRPRLLINLGIAVLMATPYLRVFISIFHFAFIQRNLKYAIFTSTVFILLTLSLFFNLAL
jgi:uncharacterized membrane protein